MRQIYQFFIHLMRMFCIARLQCDWKEIRLARNAASVHLYSDYSHDAQKGMYWLWWYFDYVGIKESTRSRL